MVDRVNLFTASGFLVPYTVSQLNAFVRDVLESEPALADVWVEGEISNVSRPASGHWYFTLKDAYAQVSCVIWRSMAQAQHYLPSNGDHVLVHGRLGVYEAGGRYQLYVDELLRAGLGNLYLEFIRLKERLEAEGLFAPERKRPLPRFPRRIGVVTSPSAAVLRDIATILRRRYPLAELVLSPTLVQGEEAPPQIVAALNALNRQGVDVIIVARGGGSLEELWAFNDEQVVRAIATSATPVVCGVGHETDFTLADFAADVRAPTPSAAAELVTPDQADLRAQIGALQVAAREAFQNALAERRLRLKVQLDALRHLSPVARLHQYRQRTDELSQRVEQIVRHQLVVYRERLAGLLRNLEGLNPSATLARGYAIVRRYPTGAVVRSVSQVTPSDRLLIRVADGEFGAEVTP